MPAVPQPVRLICANCGSNLSASEKAIGKRLRCPACGEPIDVKPPTAPEVARPSNFLKIWAAMLVGVIVILAGLFFATSDEPGPISKAPAELATNSHMGAPTVETDRATLSADAKTQEEGSLSSSVEPPTEVDPVSTEQSEKPSGGLVEGSSITIEQVQAMTGSDWLQLTAPRDREAVVTILSLSILLADQQIDITGAKSIPEFLDAYYSNRGNANTRVFDAGDMYLDHVRGIVLRAAGKGNLATDSFAYEGDGYVFLEPKSGGESGVYSVSAYNHKTARIEKANFIANFGGSPTPEMTRLRLPPGMYYLEVNSTIPWSITVLNQRGVEWLKRTMNADKNQREAEESAR